MLEFFGKWLPISRTLQLAEPSRFPLATKVNRIPGMLPKQVNYLSAAGPAPRVFHL
jgi:hypothetical protein